MSKLVVAEFLSLDGVMQAPGDADEDREGGFEHGGWQRPYFDDVAGERIGAAMAQTGSFLFGRKTYENMAAFWPTQPDDDPFAKILNGLPKYVASTTLTEPLAWERSTLLQGDVAKAVGELKQAEGGNVVVLGSGGLVQTLYENDLVDEYSLMINPIVLGGGKRLFRELPMKTLKLADSVTTSTGVVMATYVPER
jgi:dihydrofolate reductase